MSKGDVLDGEIITRPAALSTGEASTAAAEQDVPMTPMHLRVGDDLLCARASALRLNTYRLQALRVRSS